MIDVLNDRAFEIGISLNAVAGFVIDKAHRGQFAEIGTRQSFAVSKTGANAVRGLPYDAVRGSTSFISKREMAKGFPGSSI